MTVLELNGDQVRAILTESLARGLYEGSIPADPAAALKDASELVSMAMAASKNGNQSDNVNTILFIAQVDQKPKDISQMVEVTEEKPAEVTPVPPTQVVSQNVSGQSVPDGGKAEIPPSLAGFDITQITEGILDNLILGVKDNENAKAELDYFLLEKARRSGQSPQAQDEPQGEAPETVAEQSSKVATESVTTADEPGGEVGAKTEDAGAFARVQTPETSKEIGSKNKEPTAEENERRVELEKQLNYDMIKAHNVDVTKLGKVPVDKLEYILANPEGPKETEKMPVEVNPVSSGEASGGRPVGGVEETTFTPDVTATKADLGLEDVVVDESASEEREKVESLVTGPMLKAYGRGRKEVPSIGENELRFMILNSDGKVTPAELAAAKAKDGVAEEIAPINVAKQIEQEQKIEPEPLADPIRISEEKDRTITEAAAEAVAKVPEPTNVLTENDIITTPEVKKAFEDQSSIPLPSSEKQTGQERALEIIAKENFPIPPDIEGQPPILLNDVSKASRDELFSLHAQFHACESRINWVISGYEDELGDIEKLRSNREIVVAAGVPLVLEEKRVTNEYRDAQVASDKEVLICTGREHEIGKTIRKLKVLQRNYHADCERLSRQMSKYEREKNDLPR